MAAVEPIQRMIAEHLSNILKLFLPSWNFFNDFAAVPRLDVRAIKNGCESDWRPAFKDNSTRSLARIFFNPHGNLTMLQRSYIGRAADWLEENPDASPMRFENSGHHQRVVIIARTACAMPDGVEFFRFRLVTSEPGSAERILFESKALPVSEELHDT